MRALGTENMRRDNLVRCGEVGHMCGPNDRKNRAKHAVYIPLGKYAAERVVCVLIVFKQWGADMRYQRWCLFSLIIIHLNPHAGDIHLLFIGGAEKHRVGHYIRPNSDLFSIAVYGHLVLGSNLQPRRPARKHSPSEIY